MCPSRIIRQRWDRAFLSQLFRHRFLGRATLFRHACHESRRSMGMQYSAAAHLFHFHTGFARSLRRTPDTAQQLKRELWGGRPVTCGAMFCPSKHREWRNSFLCVSVRAVLSDRVSKFEIVAKSPRCDRTLCCNCAALTLSASELRWI